MNCTSGCRTKDHASYAECLRSKSIRVAWSDSATGKDYAEHKRWFSRLGEYRAARRQGIQPDTTRLEDIRRAVRASDEVGQAYQA